MQPTVPQRPVLIVEDDTDSRVMLATILTMQGYETVTSPNGLEGLAVARQHPPCLILLDLMMPVMNGEEFRHEQLQDPHLKDIPVIFITARYDAQATAARLHASGCIAKPLNVRQVLAEVAAHCLPDMPDMPSGEGDTAVHADRRSS
jgi:CheY-like chemotaxis protein